MRSARGLTLIELLTTIGIVVIVGSIAVPSFQTALRNARRASAVNSFMHAIFLARSAAIRGGTAVSICKSTDGATCLGKGSEWHGGWVVFENRDGDAPAQRDAGEPVLLVNQGWQYGRMISNRESYTFHGHRQTVVNGTVVFCDERGGVHARAIIISHTGRPRVAQRDGSNRPLKCPDG
jgi:type IV fimbrial biogenesis protein FimT